MNDNQKNLAVGVASLLMSLAALVMMVKTLSIVSEPLTVRPNISVQNVGAGNDTFGTAQIAQVEIATTTEANTGTASSSLSQGQLKNTSGRIRLISKEEMFLEGTNNTFLGGGLVWEMGTSTSQYTTSTNPIYTGTLTTSTAPQDQMLSFTASSTYSQQWQRYWYPNEYFYCSTNRAVSTTNGYCLVDYKNLN